MKHQLELDLFEQWLPIEGYEDLYQVSNLGRVKSLGNDKTRKERILKPFTNKQGYQQVSLCKDGKVKILYVHRLVAMAFIPNTNNYAEVNHIDENPSNNHISNLEWCDRKYNCNYGTRNEKVSKALSGKFGKKNNRSKQIIQLTLDGEFIKNWGSMMDVERKLGYHQSSISQCCKGRYKSANGYKWKFA